MLGEASEGEVETREEQGKGVTRGIEGDDNCSSNYIKEVEKDREMVERPGVGGRAGLTRRTNYLANKISLNRGDGI